MSVINQRAPLPTIGRVAGVAAPMEPFEQLLGTGFVRWDTNEPGPPADFAHPLFRLAVYQDLSPTRRRDLHRAAAGVLTPSAVLAHRVAAADGADDGLADELEAAARREKDAENSALEARNLLWASSLSQTPEQAERRLLAATWALIDSGQTAQAATLRDQLEACRESPTRSLLLGTIDWELGNAVEAERSFRRAAVEGEKAGDRVSAGWAWVRLGELYSTETRADEAISAAERALSLAPNEPRIERLAWICLAMGEGMSRGALAGLLRLRERLPQVGEDVPPSEADMLVTRGTLGLYAGLTTIAIDDHRAVLRGVRWGSVPNQIARCHFQTATLLINSGEWDEALVHARTALSIASDERAVWIEAQCHSVLGALAAYRGDSELATQHVTTAQEMASQRENMEALLTARIATAAIGRAQGQPQQIIDALVELPRLAPMIAALTFWPPLIVALIDAGQLQRAEDQIARLSEAAASRGLDFEARLAGLRARLAAAQSRPDKATDHFEVALRLFGSDDPFLDRALTHHAYGQLLRARGERQSAVTHLRTANQMLTTVGAQPFLTRVDDDLGAAGIHHKSGRSTLELTDREHDVALLVAKGLTNPEVAKQLYISRKAVEYHLRNVYGKLGITSRRELRTAQL
jgi:DNA-binding CsgD family transcriptional regulator